MIDIGGFPVCEKCASYYPARCERCHRELMETPLEPVLPTGSCGDFDPMHMGFIHVDKNCKAWTVNQHGH